MRATIFVFGILLALSTVANGDSQVGKDIAKAESCMDCHGVDGIDLSGTGADIIATLIKSIRAGDTNHPPGLENLSDEDIAEIAKILDRIE